MRPKTGPRTSSNGGAHRLSSVPGLTRPSPCPRRHAEDRPPGSANRMLRSREAGKRKDPVRSGRPGGCPPSETLSMREWTIIPAPAPTGTRVPGPRRTDHPGPAPPGDGGVRWALRCPTGRAMGAVPGGAHGPASGGDGEDRSKTSSVDVGYGDNHLRRGGRRSAGAATPSAPRHNGRTGNGGCSSLAFMPGPSRRRRPRAGGGGRPGPSRLRWRLGPGRARLVQEQPSTLELFKATASGWAEQATGNGSEIDYAPEALGVPLAVLVRLGAGLGPETRPDIGCRHPRAHRLGEGSGRRPAGPSPGRPARSSTPTAASGWLRATRRAPRGQGSPSASTAGGAAPGRARTDRY